MPVITIRTALPVITASLSLTCGMVWCEPAAIDAPVVRESPREFIEGLADNAIAPDPNQLYRKNGARREIDLGKGLTASLDEQPQSRVDSAVSLPGNAGTPSRVVGLSLYRPGLFGELTHSRTATGSDNDASLRWNLLDRVGLLVDVNDQRSSISDIDASRRDSGLAMRWQARPDAWIDAGVHHASIANVNPSAAAYTPDGSETFWRARAQWQPQAAPGLRLGVGAERAASATPSSLGAGRLELGADYTLRADNPLGAGLAGTRLTWREAPRLGILSDGRALDARAAFRRTLGAEVPDGSPDGAVFGQWRSRSLASNDDALLVLGWRHAWRPAPRWLLQGHVEQAVPVAGSNTLRSFSAGGRLWRGAFPDNTFVTDLEFVNSEREDSVYTAVKYTFRLSDDVLAALRMNATRTQPHGRPDLGSTAYKASGALGWLEPEDRRLSFIGRWTVTGTEADDSVATDRRAHIVLAGANYVVGMRDSASARWTRRWDRDEALPSLYPRVTTVTLGRWVHEIGQRWSLSAHWARRADALDGNAVGVGTEIGYQLSRKAVLAFGYNPRGLNDHELEVDERLKRGFTLRLRFSIDAALGRWLDVPSAPRPPAR
jgi:hypothetical protein